MSNPEPFCPGDELVIEHLSGAQKKVTFLEITGTKLSMAYVQWGDNINGKYRIDMKTGRLMPKSASLWRLSTVGLSRLQATMYHERRKAKEKIKERRLG